MNDYMVLVVPDEKGYTALGAAFNWKAGKNAAAERAAMSAYGEEIPVPCIAYAIPLGAWKNKYERIFHCENSSNHTSTGYCYKMRASIRYVLDDLEADFPVHVWEGTSTQIAFFESKNGKITRNHGYGSEIATGIEGKANTTKSVFDVLIERKFGWSVRKCRAQVKYLGVWFYAETAPDGHCNRGARGGYVSANSTTLEEMKAE